MAHPPTKVQYIYKPIEPQLRTMSMTSSPYSQRVTDRGSPSGRSNSMMGLRTMSLSNSHTGLRGPNPAHNAPINGVPRTSSILSDSSPRGNKSSSLINNASTLRKPSLTNVTPLRNSSLTNSITGRNRLGAVRANSLSSLNSNGSAGGKYIVKTTKTTDGQGRTTSITKKTMQQLPNGSVSVLKTETTTFEHIEEEEEVFDEYNFGEDFDGSYDQDTYVPEGYAQDDYEYDTHTPQLLPVRAFQQLLPLLNLPPRPLADLSEVSEEEVVVPRIRRTPENTNGLIIAGGHHVPSHKSLIPVKSILKKPEPVLEESPNIVPNGVFKAKEVATSPVPQTVLDKVDGNKVAPYASLGEPNPKSRSNDTDSTLTEPNDSVPNVKAQTEMTAANFSLPASPLLENSFPGALRDRDVPCSSRLSSMSSEFADALEEPAKYQPTLQVPEAVLRTGSIDGSSSVESLTYKRSESTPPSGDEATALSKKQDKEELKKTVKKAHSDGTEKLDVPSEPSLSRRAALVSTDRSNAEATPVTLLDQEITPTTSSAPPEGAPLDHISKPTSLPQKDSLRSSLAPARPRFIPPVQNGTLASSKLVNHDALHPEQLKTLVPDTYPSPATPDVCQPSVAKATVQTPFLFAGCGSDPASPTATTHDTLDETFESYQREPIPVDAAPKKEPALKEKPRSKFKKFMNLFVTDYH
ncbi:hypothetical protein BABINDRAFT_71441 [Babjeviella inositovora NRRL Y-12698]|uniref:Uncharacterized protein n=1 Tax=Babjeviella inositovora NRRL Y-12698 TaxID=984486 RepID=A0A1E3QXJ8_9ASCO|nr:uncharacterized protein BABINDRAFT_71441 [Babjeviella inositovora NRRL Y-12698]ODQ82395.1 hypothetical protein BABINDRAFT_71441 [Babjeviella inositovora NRRL Y-12698]